MTQFSVYKNKNPRTKTACPLLLDVQADLLGELQTRVVIPLTRSAPLRKKPLSTLTPAITVGHEKYLLLTPQLAGISRSDLGPTVGNVAAQRNAILAALDILITGI